MRISSLKDFYRHFGGPRVALRAEPPLALSISVDDIADAFYEDFATWEEGRYWWYIQMMLLAPNELIINDGYDDLYRMSFEVEDNGPGNEPTVTFGELTPVRLEPVDATILEDDQLAEPVAASIRSEMVAAAIAGIASVRGPARVAASYRSREESRPNAKEEDKQVRDYIKRMRARLGLGDDVPDEQVLAAAAARLEAEGDPDPDPAPDPAPVPDPADEPEGEPEGEPGSQQPQARTISADALAELQAQAREGAEARRQQLCSEDERYVDAAIASGKIPSRSRESTLARMGRSAEARAEEREFLDELDENVIPVEIRGNSGGGETQQALSGNLTPALEAWAQAHMPDVIEHRQRVEARRASATRPRVLTDA